MPQVGDNYLVYGTLIWDSALRAEARAGTFSTLEARFPQFDLAQLGGMRWPNLEEEAFRREVELLRRWKAISPSSYLVAKSRWGKAFIEAVLANLWSMAIGSIGKPQLDPFHPPRVVAGVRAALTATASDRQAATCHRLLSMGYARWRALRVALSLPDPEPQFKGLPGVSFVRCSREVVMLDKDLVRLEGLDLPDERVRLCVHDWTDCGGLYVRPEAQGSTQSFLTEGEWRRVRALLKRQTAARR